MINEVRLAFTALRSRRETPSEEDDLVVLPIGSISGVFVGVDAQSRQHLLLKSDSDVPPVADVATLAVATRSLVIGGVDTRVVDVVCLLGSLVEVFDHFVASVIEQLAATDDTTANNAVETVLQRWRHFLIPPTGPPGRDKLAAILGELLVVADVVDTSTVAGIGFWSGPFGSRHDLRQGDTAIEVKTTRAHSTHRVTIHGEDQLLAPDGGALYLHFVRLEEVHGSGRSVASVVDELLAVGVPADKLFEALSAAGLNVVDLAATAEITFDIRERLTLVVDEHFPRIVPDSFRGGKRPAGVIDLSYVVDLGGQLERALTTTAYRDLVRSVGSGNAA